REHWRVAVTGATLSIEDSIFFAQASGPRPTRQIVLRGICAGETEVSWAFEMLGDTGSDVQLAAALASIETAILGLPDEPVVPPPLPSDGAGAPDMLGGEKASGPPPLPDPNKDKS
ncbi:MAG TPA: hypothetical protein PK264_14510, partial [Hyphomicrobiaceae bacterium]|nr:hypothetical protein [Hyphomicrobiaceae bacterium]